MRVQFAPQRRMRWLEQKTGCVLTRNARAIEVVDGAITRGMVAFDAWTPQSAQAHMAVEAPILWRHLLPAAARYLYETEGRQLAIGLIPASNGRSVRTALSLGFSLQHRVRDGWSAGVDLLVLEMRKQDCRSFRPEMEVV